jgi:hypothetical protein
MVSSCRTWVFVLAWAFSPPSVRALSVPMPVCACDCDENGFVTVDELVNCVGIALGVRDLSSCPSADVGDEPAVTVDELVLAVRNALEGCPSLPTATPEPPTRSPTVSPSPTPTSASENDVPTNPTELLAWLRAGRYLEWQAESGIHRSTGPHTSRVRTYVNDILFESLRSGLPAHPAGAAAVKELYGNGSAVLAWAVEVKVQADSADGFGWYWYEGANLSGLGLGICTNCHSGGLDYVLTPFPLQ